MAKIKCTDPRGGVKTCKITERGKTRTVRMHTSATPGTKAKRKAAAKRLKDWRFKASDAKACRQKNPKARGKCMWGKVEARQ